MSPGAAWSGSHGRRSVARPPYVTIRVPAAWENLGELQRRLPSAVRVTERSLALPGRSRLDLNILPRDPYFCDLFIPGCVPSPTASEADALRRSTVLACVSTNGGTRSAALRILDAAAVLLRAGGLGVFCDNSGACVGVETCLACAEHPGPDALLMSFVRRYRDEHDIYSVGMHVFGRRDVMLERSADGMRDDSDLCDFLLYCCQPDWELGDGDLVGDSRTPRFRLLHEPTTPVAPECPLYNPYGRWRLDRLQSALGTIGP